MQQTSAPGKLILCGEHAVVYNQPALAIPLQDIRATVTIAHAQVGAGLTVTAPDLGVVWRLRAQEPLSFLAEQTLRYLELPEPDIDLTIESAIPLASGMGSGAAVGAALVRALAVVHERSLEPAEISELVYLSECSFHGTPSGIDNTVVAYEHPIRFQRNLEPPHAIQAIPIQGSWNFLVADTGVASATKSVVEAVRQRYQREPLATIDTFTTIGHLVHSAQSALAQAAYTELGQLLTANHHYLQALDVSSVELDGLVTAALNAGAWGAKLSGAGRGGVMLALIEPSQQSDITQALYVAGARQVWFSRLEGV